MATAIALEFFQGWLSVLLPTVVLPTVAQALAMFQPLLHHLPLLQPLFFSQFSLTVFVHRESE
jgi:hypothetical protein